MSQEVKRSELSREAKAREIDRVIAQCIREWPEATKPRQGGGPTYAEGLRAFWMRRMDEDPGWVPPLGWAGPHIASKPESWRILGINPPILR